MRGAREKGAAPSPFFSRDDLSSQDGTGTAAPRVDRSQLSLSPDAASPGTATKRPARPHGRARPKQEPGAAPSSSPGTRAPGSGLRGGRVDCAPHTWCIPSPSGSPHTSVPQAGGRSPAHAHPPRNSSEPTYRRRLPRPLPLQPQSPARVQGPRRHQEAGRARAPPRSRPPSREEGQGRPAAAGRAARPGCGCPTPLPSRPRATKFHPTPPACGLPAPLSHPISSLALARAPLCPHPSPDRNVLPSHPGFSSSWPGPSEFPPPGSLSDCVPPTVLSSVFHSASPTSQDGQVQALPLPTPDQISEHLLNLVTGGVEYDWSPS